MKLLWMQRLIRCALVSAMLGMTDPASAADYSVSYNPYSVVVWESTLRCQSEHHDHAAYAERVLAIDAAGYCAVVYMTYSGAFRASTPAEWSALGEPIPDPGRPLGWGPPRRWPPESFGAPALPLTNLKFYLPGAEEVGLYADGNYGEHIQSMFMETYIEAEGCESCGISGIPVHRNPDGLPESQIHTSTQDLMDKIVLNGGHATVNHPGGPPDHFQGFDNFSSIEMFNNFWRNLDDHAGTNTASDKMMAAWDHLLEHKSPRIWGIAVNDWYAAWTPLGETYNPDYYPVVTEQNRDRGKLQVLLTSYDVEAYRFGFEAGASFAIVEDNAIKNAYPTVTRIVVNYNSIAITTQAGDETIRWIGNGEVLSYGATLGLTNLPGGLVYVRAEIDDGDGRTVYTQPFTLGDPLPPPPGAPIPTVPRYVLGLEALLLLAAVSWKVHAATRRG